MKIPNMTRTFEKLVNESISNLETQDILHDDGSKTYSLMYGGSVHIERPYVVKLIEDILEQDYRGYSYMPVLESYFKNGSITEYEYKQIIKILD